jgi:hypothetical protein
LSSIGALDPNVQAMMVLEDIEANSITAWVANRLRQVDDQAIKDFDWKKQVGSFAVKTKYRVLEFLDQKATENEHKSLIQLRDDLTKLASEPLYRHLPLPGAIPLEDLVTPLDRIQESKSLLSKADRLIIRTDDKEYEVDLSEQKKPSTYLGEMVPEITAVGYKWFFLSESPITSATHFGSSGTGVKP